MKSIGFISAESHQANLFRFYNIYLCSFGSKIQ